MGWRTAFVLVLEAGEPNGLTYANCQQVADALLAMPAPDRIALARELLPAGFVVAREVACPFNDTRAVTGWNACRAAMMAEVIADDLPGIKAQILNRRAMMGEGE
jgi:hypothetical protein